MKQASYEDIRPCILMGDVLMFGGSGFISGGIKLFTHSPLSHAAGVFRPEADGRVLLVESTSLNGQKGVQTNYASERIKEYDQGGRVWWLPLADGVRARADWLKWGQYLNDQIGKPYDYKQCLQMIWAPLAHVPGLGFIRNHESIQRFYCSELISSAFEACGVIPFGSVDFSDCAPADLAAFHLYGEVVQIVGKPCEIPHFNTVTL